MTVMMGRRTGTTVTLAVVLVVAWAAVSVEECWCWDRAAAAMEDAEESRRSWASDMFCEGIGLDKDKTKEAAQGLLKNVGNAASKANDQMNSAAFETSQYASDKAREAANMDFSSDKGDQGKMIGSDKAKETLPVAMGYGRDRAADAYISASDIASEWVRNAKCSMAEAIEHGKERASEFFDESRKGMNTASSVASDKATNAKETIEKAWEQGRDRASDAYDQAKQRVDGASETKSEKSNKEWETVAGASGRTRNGVGNFNEAAGKVEEAYHVARETMTDQAKAAYESAKERMSHATGDLGNEMRKGSAEM